ncbi:MAG TPA: hypothetical protein VG078_10315 [Acidimicrobiales bacterium]|nr:hypothetical protein [Acidimicrobiales bacterium]
MGAQVAADVGDTLGTEYPTFRISSLACASSGAVRVRSTARYTPKAVSPRR